MKLSSLSRDFTPEEMAELYAHPDAMAHPYLTAWLSKASADHLDRFVAALPEPLQRYSYSYMGPMAEAYEVSDKLLATLSANHQNVARHVAQRENRARATSELLSDLALPSPHDFHPRREYKEKCEGIAGILAERTDVTDADLAKIFKHHFDNPGVRRYLPRHPNAGPALAVAMLRNANTRSELRRSPLAEKLFRSQPLMEAYLKALQKTKHHTYYLQDLLSSIFNTNGTPPETLSERLAIIIDLANDPEIQFGPQMTNQLLEMISLRMETEWAPVLTPRTIGRLLALTNHPQVRVPATLRTKLFGALPQSMSTFKTSSQTR